MTQQAYEQYQKCIADLQQQVQQLQATPASNSRVLRLLFQSNNQIIILLNHHNSHTIVVVKKSIVINPITVDVEAEVVGVVLINVKIILANVGLMVLDAIWAGHITIPCLAINRMLLLKIKWGDPHSVAQMSKQNDNIVTNKLQ